MKKHFVYLFFLLLISHISRSQTPSTSPTVGPEQGSLMIVGGGAMGPELWNKFVELAGGPDKADIIIIPTAGEDSAASSAPREKEKLTSLGVKNITILHTRDPKVANQESFVAPLRKATGIWFVGGRHWRLADSYLNTLAHKEFNALLSRGGIIGGTSAGATIQGSFMVRGDTKGNSIMVGDHTQGLDFIHNVTIDQHVMRRNRQFDLIDVIKTRPELLGIGIDEGTAILVQKNTFEVLGASYVGIYEAGQIASSAKYPSGMNSTGGPFYYLSKGQKFDLKTRKVISTQPTRTNEPAK
ncbi:MULTISPECIES: cyanophycinase [unclassified Spirosoma]|uniref:cyanophycinase n=1 Tax=unclassified Spirosoma TaxID=2621999 RepID=UPI00096978DF|nr:MULTISPECIES: cyanophycinase [unclassified Spirosoma]MBN8822050.1 cyanophycinase [Spirosoma sp.]OJW80456.1 MAG: cyanophycinase [Spirosoma sp. 48-14]